MCAARMILQCYDSWTAPYPPRMPGAALHAPRARLGQAEASLCWRLMQDDSRGVAEPLNETVCGCRDCDCPGLIARGTFQLLLAPHTPDSHRRLRALQTLAAEPPLPLYGRGSDIVRWLATHMHEDSGGEVAVSGGAAVEDVRAAAAPAWGGSERVGTNSSDLWPVGASDLIASNPLAKAVLKRIGDNGVVRIETSAAGYARGAHRARLWPHAEPYPKHSIWTAVTRSHFTLHALDLCQATRTQTISWQSAKAEHQALRQKQQPAHHIIVHKRPADHSI